MGYPDEIFTPQTREDGGVAVSESKTIDSTAHTVILDHYARSRETLSDGRVISSTIRVAKGGKQYTQVYQTPVPSGAYFYHYEDPSSAVNSSVLLFNTVDSGIVDITYETRGDYIQAARHNLIETDLAAIETALGADLLQHQYGVIENTGASPADIDIAITDANAYSVVVLLSSEGGNTYGFTVSPTLDKVTVSTVAAGDKVHYLLLVSQL